MGLLKKAVLLLVALWHGGAAQAASLAELTRGLSSPETRDQFIANMDPRTATTDLLALAQRLMADTTKPEKYELQIGVALAFQRFPDASATEFLIRFLVRERSFPFHFAPWTKTEPRIIYDYPAIGALLKIGAAAREPLVRAFHTKKRRVERLAVIFTVARLGEANRTLRFLRGIRPETNFERYYIGEAIALQEGKPFRYKGPRPTSQELYP